MEQVQSPADNMTRKGRAGSAECRTISICGIADPLSKGVCLVDRLEWTESCNFGIAEIDGQHRRIFGMINRLIDEKEATTHSETIGDLLAEMTAYAQEHLRYEERLLEEIGYPDLEPHKRLHRVYRKKTVDFCTATTLGVESVPEALLEYLRSWWLHHILHDDRAYMPFVEAGSTTTRADGPSGPRLAGS